MSFHKWSTPFLSLLLSLPIALDFPAFAQEITGSVTGSVADASGAVIVGAKVALTNTGTSKTDTTVSDASGNFKFFLLPPANYTVEASMTGFKTFRREGIIVEADRSLGVPITLSLGQATETVEVVGGTPLLDPNTSEVGTTVTNQYVMELPLNARNPMGLTNLVPTAKGVGYFGGQILTSWRVGSVNIGGGQASPVRSCSMECQMTKWAMLPARTLF